MENMCCWKSILSWFRILRSSNSKTKCKHKDVRAWYPDKSLWKATYQCSRRQPNRSSVSMRKPNSSSNNMGLWNIFPLIRHLFKTSRFCITCYSKACRQIVTHIAFWRKKKIVIHMDWSLRSKASTRQSSRLTQTERRENNTIATSNEFYYII